MYVIDRQVAIIRPKQPFLDWLGSVPDPNPLDITLADLRHNCRVVLIPEFDNEAEAKKYLIEIYHKIFEMELNCWYGDRELWPRQRNLQIFNEWFDIEIHSTVFDILKEKIEKQVD